jgi:transcriptional regulator with XRE-family HTH domain
MKTLNMRQERLNRGWSLDFVANQLGITKSAAQMLETAQRKPSYEVLCKLEDLFNLPHRQLFSDGNENDSTTQAVSKG